MSYGLSVWNEIGGLQIDTTRRYLRVYSVITYTFSANIYDITIPVPGFTQDGSWYASCVSTDINSSNMQTYDHRTYASNDGFVSVKYLGRTDTSFNFYPSTGRLTIYRV